MKVFISWSGERSRELGSALHAWLPLVLQYDGLFRRTIRVARPKRCVLQTGVFGSALRAHFVRAPAAEASVMRSGECLTRVT